MPSDFEINYHDFIVCFSISIARSNGTKSCEKWRLRSGSLTRIWLSVLGNQSFCVFLPIFQVPDSGNYTFYLSCDNWCELWTFDVDEDGMENRDTKSEESLTKQPIIAFDTWTGHLQWNKWATHERDIESFFLNSELFCLLSGMLLFPLNLHCLSLFFSKGTQVKCRNQFFLTNVVFIKWRSLCVKL